MSDTPQVTDGFSLKKEPASLVDSALQVYARTGLYPESRTLHDAAMAYRRELIRIVTEHADLRRDIAAANTVIARMRETLEFSLADWERINSLAEHQPRFHPYTGQVESHRDALSLTPATVRDEVAALQKEVMASRALANLEKSAKEVAQRERDDAFQFVRHSTGAELANIEAMTAELTALRTRAEKAEADVARLDWISDMDAMPEWDDNGFWKIRYAGMWHSGRTVRAAIDASMKADAARQPTPQPHEEGKR